MDENAIGKRIVDAAVQIHRELGPGLLERVYEVVLARELEHRGLREERQRGLSAGCGSRVLASWRETPTQAESDRREVLRDLCCLRVKRIEEYNRGLGNKLAK